LRNEKNLELREFGGKKQRDFMKSEGKRTTKRRKCCRRREKRRKNKSWAKKI